MDRAIWLGCKSLSSGAFQLSIIWGSLRRFASNLPLIICISFMWISSLWTLKSCVYIDIFNKWTYHEKHFFRKGDILDLWHEREINKATDPKYYYWRSNTILRLYLKRLILSKENISRNIGHNSEDKGIEKLWHKNMAHLNTCIRKKLYILIQEVFFVICLYVTQKQIINFHVEGKLELDGCFFLPSLHPKIVSTQGNEEWNRTDGLFFFHSIHLKSVSI